MEGELQRLAKLTERPKREEVDANEQDENVKKRRSLHITEHEDEQEAVRYGQPPDAGLFNDTEVESLVNSFHMVGFRKAFLLSHYVLEVSVIRFAISIKEHMME